MSFFVSIVVPSYNKPEYLAECLRSIQEQQYESWECIIVNDRSPRSHIAYSTIDLMKDARFRIISHSQNRGPAAARNTGVKHSTGNLVFFLDEDDTLDCKCLNKLVERIAQTCCDIVCCKPVLFGDAVRQMSVSIPNKTDVLTGRFPLGVGFLIRRELWNKLGGWDESTELNGREDNEWWIRAVYSNLRIEIVEDAYYYYRQFTSCDSMQKSLNAKSRIREAVIRKYIVHKHHEKYSLHNAERSKYLAEGYRWQAGAFLKLGQYCKSCLLFVQAAMISRERFDVEWAAATFLNCIIGRQATQTLKRIIHAGVSLRSRR
jgi:glycosyltransferase involved in cell wall biosynthesis